MNSVKVARQRRGLSQRQLAERSHLSFRGIQLLESRGHDARLSSLEKVAAGLSLPASGVRTVLAGLFDEAPDSLYCATLRILVDGEPSWKRHLFDFVDAFRRAPSLRLVETPPIPSLSPRLGALMAGTVESLGREADLPKPGWLEGTRPLDEPWFPSGFESLKASALVESPLAFRRRNVFVLGNFLDRA